MEQEFLNYKNFLKFFYFYIIDSNFLTLNSEITASLKFVYYYLSVKPIKLSCRILVNSKFLYKSFKIGLYGQLRHLNMFFTNFL